MARKANALISPSPKPMSMWMPVIAVKPTDHSTVSDHASWPAQATEASTVEPQPANATAATCPRTPGRQRLTAR